MISKARFALYASLLILIAAASTAAFHARADAYSFFDPLIDVKRILAERYVDKVDDKKLQEGAIAGMIEALGDPYTLFVPASDRDAFNKDLTGEYVGIGAQVQMLDGWLTIVTPLEDSPALRAGVMAGDRVVEIEGQTTLGLSVEQCIDRLVGQPGTDVRIAIDRQGERIEKTITRAAIKTRSVKGVHRDPANAERWVHQIDPARGIGYVRVTQFTPGVSQEVLEALRGMGAERGELKGLVLDLRWNPGGLLPEAVRIADLFLADGTIVSTRGRSVAEQIAKAQSEGTLPEFPIAVILNEQSASASEVLAGALVENNRAVAVGSRSFGKGSVQVIVPLDRGAGELKITEQGYFLPSGRSITRKDDSQTWGVDPSEGFYVPLTDSELIDLLRVRRELEVLRTDAASRNGAEPERWDDPVWIVERLKDKQLGAALRAVQLRIDSGSWQPTGEPGLASTRIAGDEARRLRLAADRLNKELLRVENRLSALDRGEPTPAESRDLWGDGVRVAGGRVTVTDKNGVTVAELDITGEDLERWLAEADLKKRQDPGR